MIKKFFKAVLMGLRNSEDLISFGKLFVVVGWLPMLFTLILKIFKINVSEGESFLLLFITAIWGSIISEFICHCVEAMRYQEQNQCDFHTAWKATSSIEDDDY